MRSQPPPLLRACSMHTEVCANPTVRCDQLRTVCHALTHVHGQPHATGAPLAIPHSVQHAGTAVAPTTATSAGESKPPPRLTKTHRRRGSGSSSAALALASFDSGFAATASAAEACQAQRISSTCVQGAEETHRGVPSAALQQQLPCILAGDMNTLGGAWSLRKAVADTTGPQFDLLYATA